MKIRTWFKLGAVLLFCAAAAFLLLRFNPFAWELPGLSLFSTEKISARDMLLQETRAVYRLNTVELVHKSVFPFDYMPENPDWRTLFYNQAVGELTEEEKSLVEFYRFCRSLGIDLAARAPGFAVVTVIVRAGFNLESYPMEEHIIQRGESLTVSLPAPIVTEIIIQDPGAETYPYPGLEISPENWKRLTDFVTAGITPVIEKSGLLQKGAERGEELLRRLAAPRGFSEISFIYGE